MVLVGLKIRQLNMAACDKHKHEQPSDFYVGRYTSLGFLGLVILTCLTLSGVFLNFLDAKILSNSITASPSDLDLLAIPKPIVPEWYFLAGYSVLRSVPDKIFGLFAFFGMFIIPLILPWLDQGPLKPIWRRPYYAPFFALFLISIMALFYFGAQPFEDQIVVWTRVAAVYYFAHLLIIIPIISRLEIGQYKKGVY